MPSARDVLTEWSASGGSPHPAASLSPRGAFPAESSACRTIRHGAAQGLLATALLLLSRPRAAETFTLTAAHRTGVLLQVLRLDSARPAMPRPSTPPGPRLAAFDTPPLSPQSHTTTLATLQDGATSRRALVPTRRMWATCRRCQERARRTRSTSPSRRPRRLSRMVGDEPTSTRAEASSSSCRPLARRTAGPSSRRTSQP